MKSSNGFFRLIAAALIGAVVAIALFTWLVVATLSFPSEWMRIQPGEHRTEVHLHCAPNVGSLDFEGEKGDFWYSTRPLGRWELNVTYDEQKRVRAKQLTLQVGSKDHFRRFIFL